MLAIAGCTLGAVPEATGLGGADVAVYVTEFTNEKPADGKVLLLDRSGPVGVVTTSAINNPDLLWDTKGLFFSDQQAEYNVSDRVERQVRPEGKHLTGDWLVAFEYGADDAAGHLLVYAKSDLALVETRQLTKLADVVGQDRMVLAVAVRPDFTPQRSG